MLEWWNIQRQGSLRWVTNKTFARPSSSYCWIPTPWTKATPLCFRGHLIWSQDQILLNWLVLLYKHEIDIWNWTFYVCMKAYIFTIYILCIVPRNNILLVCFHSNRIIFYLSIFFLLIDSYIPKTNFYLACEWWRIRSDWLPFIQLIPPRDLEWLVTIYSTYVHVYIVEYMCAGNSASLTVSWTKFNYNFH